MPQTLTVVENCIGYFTGSDHDHFEKLTNFCFEPVWQIKTTEKSGYVAKVRSQEDEHTRLCYYSNEDAQNVQTFTTALNRTYGGGLLTRKEFKALFEDYIFNVTYNFKQNAFERGSHYKFEAASCCGLQPAGDAYVLNESIHINLEGAFIPEEERKYMWLGEAVQTGILGSIASPKDAAKIKMPLANNYSALYNLAASMESCLHENFISGFFALAASMMCHNYQTVLSCWNQFPVPVLVGDINKGKSTALLAAISLYGQDESRIFSGQSHAWLVRYASKRNINPFGVEDMDDSKELKSLLKTFFQSNVRATNATEDKPRVCPILAANWETLDQMKAAHDKFISRVVLIPFISRNINIDFNKQAEAEENMTLCMLEASALYGMMVKLGNCFKLKADQDLIKKTLFPRISAMCPGVESRVAKSTSLLVYHVLKLWEAILPCAEENDQLKTLLSDQSLWSFVEDVIIMHGIKRYLTSPTSVKVDSTQLSKMDQTLFSFMAMFVERLPVHEVLQLINPAVTCNSQRSIAVRLPKLLQILSEEGYNHLSEKEIRRQINLGHGLSPATQYFLAADSLDTTIKRGKSGNSKADRCVIIYLQAIEDQYLDVILKASGISKANDGKSQSNTQDLIQPVLKDNANDTQPPPTTPEDPIQPVLREENDTQQSNTPEHPIQPVLKHNANDIQPPPTPPEDPIQPVLTEENETQQPNTPEQLIQPVLKDNADDTQPQPTITLEDPIVNDTQVTQPDDPIHPMLRMNLNDTEGQSNTLEDSVQLMLIRDRTNDSTQPQPTTQEDPIQTVQRDHVNDTDHEGQPEFPSPERKQLKLRRGGGSRRRCCKQLSFNSRSQKEDHQTTFCACGCGTQYQYKSAHSYFWIQCDWCDKWWIGKCVPLTEDEKREYKTDKRKKFRCTHC